MGNQLSPPPEPTLQEKAIPWRHSSAEQIEDQIAIHEMDGRPDLAREMLAIYRLIYPVNARNRSIAVICEDYQNRQLDIEERQPTPPSREPLSTWYRPTQPRIGVPSPPPTPSPSPPPQQIYLPPSREPLPSLPPLEPVQWQLPPQTPPQPRPQSLPRQRAMSPTMAAALAFQRRRSPQRSPQPSLPPLQPVQWQTPPQSSPSPRPPYRQRAMSPTMAAALAYQTRPRMSPTASAEQIRSPIAGQSPRRPIDDLLSPATSQSSAGQRRVMFRQFGPLAPTGSLYASTHSSDGRLSGRSSPSLSRSIADSQLNYSSSSDSGSYRAIPSRDAFLPRNVRRQTGSPALSRSSSDSIESIPTTPLPSSHSSFEPRLQGSWQRRYNLRREASRAGQRLPSPSPPPPYAESNDAQQALTAHQQRLRYMQARNEQRSGELSGNLRQMDVNLANLERQQRQLDEMKRRSRAYER